MTFWLGVLVGCIVGIVFTMWVTSPSVWNACPKGGFHFWEEYMYPEGISRICSKCGIGEEA